MKTKILLVATDYTPGMQAYAIKIINALSEREELDIYAVVVAYKDFSYNGMLADKALSRTSIIEYPHEKLKGLLCKFFPLDCISAINKITKENHINKVHLLTGDFRMWPYVLLSKKKLYYTVHDLEPHEIAASDLRTRLILGYIHKAYLYNVKHIKNLTTSSQTQLARLKELYPNKHISFTHFPSLVTERMRNGNKKVTELSGIDNYILFFGGIAHYKGVDILLEAYNLLDHEIRENVRLVIAGKECDKVLNYKKNGVIRLNRFFQDEELKDLYTKAQLVVYPYRSATMTGVLSLAYYFKRKVLVSNIDFFMQNRSKNTFVFEKSNAKSLKDAIIKAMNTTVDVSKDYDQIYSEKNLQGDCIKFYSL